MTKNKLSDLNDHLFMALERLNEEDITREAIETESKRAEAIIGLSTQIISNAKITLDAMKLATSNKLDIRELPENFGIKSLGLKEEKQSP